MTVASAAAAAPTERRLARVRWALMFGNFVIGCGLMVVPGTLNDIARSLQVSVSLAGQLIAIGAATVCFGAPLLAGWVAAFDRRRLLTFSLVVYAAAPALLALNTSAIYLGQATGAASGGWLIAHHGYGPLSYAGTVWIAVAVVVSIWATRAAKRRAA